MDCRAVETQLSAWTDGQLDAGRATEVRDHLVQCPSCWGEFQALEAVHNRLATLKMTPVPESPPGLTAVVRALPTWLVRVAVARRWLAPGMVAACVAFGVVGLFSWSKPLPATLSLREIRQTQTLTPGTTLMARLGETVTVTLPPGEGKLQLHGPGSLIVHRASQGALRQDQRLNLELPSGRLTVRFGTRMPAHRLMITTPQALVRLAGTWVLLQAGPAATSVVVMEGEAQVRNRATGQAVKVIPGQMVTIQAGWLTVQMVPVEEWLKRKGVAATPSESESAQPTAPASAPLSFETNPTNTKPCCSDDKT